MTVLKAVSLDMGTAYAKATLAKGPVAFSTLLR
jgi:hypothetical protein